MVVLVHPGFGPIQRKVYAFKSQEKPVWNLPIEKEEPKEAFLFSSLYPVKPITFFLTPNRIRKKGKIKFSLLNMLLVDSFVWFLISSLSFLLLLVYEEPYQAMNFFVNQHIQNLSLSPVFFIQLTGMVIFLYIILIGIFRATIGAYFSQSRVETCSLQAVFWIAVLQVITLGGILTLGWPVRKKRGPIL